MNLFTATAVLAVGGLALFGGPAHRKTERGNAFYGEGAYEEALRAYTEAQVAAPEAPELHYDIGNVLYRQGNPEGAAEAYNRALSSAPASLAPPSAYNLGNALYQQGRYEEAVRAYTKALQAAPADRDAKQNLELALRALKQRQPQPQPSPRQGEKKPEPQQQEKQKGGGGQDKKPDQERQGGNMTPEEAKRLLDRLADEERENLKRDRERQARRLESSKEKDW